jgi:clan AA aspartic protease
MAQLKLTNIVDQQYAADGILAPEAVRTETIEALVDTGATLLILPADVVQRLGFVQGGRRPVRYANGTVEEVPWVRAVGIEILGREMTCDALVVPTGNAALVGQIPLEGLDLVVDPKSGDVMPNPRNPDGPVMEALSAA